MLSRITSTLNEIHNALCDNGTPQSVAQAKYAIEKFRAAGIITPEEARIRILALSTCPSHNDSRTWCAYCGEVTVEDEYGT